MGAGSGIAGYSAQLATADRTFRALFTEQLIMSQAEFAAKTSLLAMEMPTPGKKSVSHNWMGAVPQMEKWVGNRKLAKLLTEGHVINNDPWATGIEVDGDDIEDNTLGLYTPAIRELALEGVWHRYNLIRDLLNDGFSGLGYDGVAFFSDSHPNAGGTAQDNYTDDVLDVAAYKAADVRLSNQVNEEGHNRGLMTTHLIVGPDLKWTGKEIVENDRLASGATNNAAGTAQLVVIPGLTAGYWFVADLSRIVKPFILQTKRPLRPDSMTSADSPNVFHEDKHYFGASWKGGAGYLLWQLIQGSDGTGT